MNTTYTVGWRSIAPLAGMLLLLSSLAPIGARGESHLSVDYRPPRLSVEAHEVSLAAVLREIGAQVGFSVVETAASPTIVTVTIKDAALDDVLRQLLRTENHTVLYRAGVGASPVIDSIVLSGEPSVTGPAVAVAQQARPQDRPQGAAHDQIATPSRPVVSPAAPEPWPGSAPALSSDGSAMVGAGDDETPITVGDMLKAHAAAAAALGTPPDAAGAGDSSSPPRSLDVALAETTRRAQQALAALMDGLATATQSLQQSLSAGPK